jgi:hypothetical protein
VESRRGFSGITMRMWEGQNFLCLTVNEQSTSVREMRSENRWPDRAAGGKCVVKSNKMWKASLCPPNYRREELLKMR